MHLPVPSSTAWKPQICPYGQADSELHSGSVTEKCGNLAYDLGFHCLKASFGIIFCLGLPSTKNIKGLKASLFFLVFDLSQTLKWVIPKVVENMQICFFFGVWVNNCHLGGRLVFRLVDQLIGWAYGKYITHTC